MLDKRKINLEDWIVLWMLWWPADRGRPLSALAWDSSVWHLVSNKREEMKWLKLTPELCLTVQLYSHGMLYTAHNHMHKCTLLWTVSKMSQQSSLGSQSANMNKVKIKSSRRNTILLNKYNFWQFIVCTHLNSTYIWNFKMRHEQLLEFLLPTKKMSCASFSLK